jgi:hypothetical protein
MATPPLPAFPLVLCLLAVAREELSASTPVLTEKELDKRLHTARGPESIFRLF